MSKIAGELNAEMTKAVRDEYRVLFAEMVRKTGSNQSVLDRLVQEVYNLRAQVSELEASPLSEEALDILRDRNEQLERAIDEEMVVCHLGVFGSNDDPRTAIKKLMQWSQDVGEFFAKETIKNLKKERDQLKEALLIEQANGEHWANAYSEWVNTDKASIKLIELGEERDTIAAQNEDMREAIELYFKQYPHMMKGYILDAINSPNLAAEVLKRRDAETLRRAAKRFECAVYTGHVSTVLSLWAAELEKETT